MDERNIHEVIRDVFGPIPTKTINGWVSINCPVAPWKHETGKDSSASAGVSINDNGASIFNCFTCKTKMPLHAVIGLYANYTGEDYDDLIAELEEEAYLGGKTLPDWDETKDNGEPLVPLKASVYLDLFDSAAGHWYLRERGISDETARKLQLMVDPQDSEGEERILFPVFGPTGELYGLSGRAIRKEARLKVRDYHGLKKARCVLGSHLLVSEKSDHVCLVEGLFDYARGWECGQPTAAVMHSTLTEWQAEIIRDIGKPTYLFYDDDKAGQGGVEIAGNLLARYVPVMKVRYPEIWIEDPDEAEGGHYVGDPGELDTEDFDAMKADARLF